MTNECKKCNGQGFVESIHMKSAQEFKNIVLCPVCRDIAGYSREVKARHFVEETPQERINRLIGRGR